MCGLSGVISFSNLKFEDGRCLELIHNSLKHRGPDASGITAKRGALEIQFAHHRLSIQDVSSIANQPMLSPSGAMLVYNGEIYNSEELRIKLSSEWEFKTSGDTEVLLALLEKWGMEGVSKVEGMFAFAYVNPDASEVLLGRDRLGIKPLYLYKSSEQIWFASESSALGRAFHRPLDPIAFHEWAIFQFPISDRTFFDGVVSVPPASVISVRRESIRTKRYWNLEDFLPNQVLEPSLEPEDLLSLIESTIKDQMVSDVPVGSFCSGGMDSSLVTSIASKFGLSKAYVGDYGIPDYSEVEFAKYVCKNANLPLEIIKISASDYWAALPKVISCLDFPIAGPGSVGQFLVTERASSDVKVLLSGSGGDELFLGYTRDRLPLLAAGLLAIANKSKDAQLSWNVLTGDLGSLSGYSDMLKAFSNANGFINPLLGFMEVVDRRASTFDMFNLDPSLVKSVKAEALTRISPNGGESLQEIHTSLLRYEIQYFLGSLLHVEDRVSMRSGVEVRVPLLSTSVLEHVLPLSLATRMRGGRPKDILREAGKKVLPKEILARKDKMGFPVPIDIWLKAEANKTVISDALSRLEARGFDFYDPTKSKHAFSSKGVANRGLWALLSLDAWLSSNS